MKFLFVERMDFLLTLISPLKQTKCPYPLSIRKDSNYAAIITIFIFFTWFLILVIFFSWIDWKLIKFYRLNFFFLKDKTKRFLFIFLFTLFSVLYTCTKDYFSKYFWSSLSSIRFIYQFIVVVVSILLFKLLFLCCNWNSYTFYFRNEKKK